MNIAIIDVDGHASKKKWGATIYPNLALAKLAAWHKQQGDLVEWYTPFAQPYRDPLSPHHTIPQWQRDLAQHTNKKQLFVTCDFKDFSPRKGFTCKEYFI